MDFDDYWVQSPQDDHAPAEPALQIDTIDGVEPLDAQLGVADLKTAPDALYEPLFGQPSDVPLHTYAILDAAKVPNLPELLEASGLDHSCLFKGEAYDELKDVAPWVVRLEDGNAFTRNLFTRSDAPWHLWDAEPGIYLRSKGSLKQVYQHFRKFTKIQTSNRKWYYFRFWEPVSQFGFVRACQLNQPEVRRFFECSQMLIHFNVYFPSEDVMVRQIESTESTISSLSRISPRQLAEKIMPLVHSRRVNLDLLTLALGIDPERAGAKSLAFRSLCVLFECGFRKEAQLVALCRIDKAFGYKFLNQPKVQSLLANTPADYNVFISITKIAANQGYQYG